MAAPAAASAFAAGVVGITTAAGFVLLGVAVAYLSLALFWLQPRLGQRALQAGVIERASERFLRVTAESDRIDKVALEFATAVSTALGPTKALIVAPDPILGIRVFSEDPADLNQDLSDCLEAFLWLGDSVEPMTRSELVQLDEIEGARRTVELLDKVRCDILLPLRHRGLLLGLALIGNPLVAGTADRAQFLKVMRTYVTAAIANTFLAVEARGQAGASHSLDLANAIQESLMPEERPVRGAFYELFGLFRPVAECGGDLWVWRELPGQKVLLVVADATGHGAAPALLSAVAKGAVDGYAQVVGGSLMPSKLLSMLNHQIYRVARRRYLMSAFAAVVDTKTGVTYYSNAGLNFPYLLSEGRIEALVVRGDTLGSAPESHFEDASRRIVSGDKILLYTDGIIDAGSPMVERFGERRFRALLAELVGTSAIHIPARLLNPVLDYTKQVGIGDDITLVAFEYGSVGQEL